MTWIQDFVNYDIVISDQSWYYAIIILTRKFYAFFLSLPKGDLDLMHRILYIWILNIEFWLEHRIFVNYDIVISDQSWCYNIIILSRNFYAFYLTLPKGDLEVMHRILYVSILTKVKFKHAIIVFLKLYSSFEFCDPMLFHMWMLFQN